MTPPTVLSFIETYRACREGVVGQVVECDVVRVAGKDALSYLQGQTTQELTGLVAGDSVESLLLSSQGRTDAYVRIAVLGDEEVLVVVAGGYGDVVYERLRRFRIRVKAELTSERWACAQLRGPGAALAAEGFDGVVLPASWPGVDGVDLLAPGATLPDGVPAGDPLALDAVRIESGEPVMGREVTDRTIAQEAGLVDRAVSFTKGCYLGQELIARIDARGNNVPKRLLGVVVPAEVGRAHDEEGAGVAVVAPGAVLTVDGSEVGELTSVAWSPTLEATVALAYVRRAVTAPAVGSIDRDGADPLAVRIVELPILT